MGDASPSRPLRAGAIALLVGSLLVFASQCVGDPKIPFLFASDAAPWIGFPTPPDGMMGLARRDALPVLRFERSFEIDADILAPVQLEVRALRAFRLWLDDAELALPDTRHWREFRRIEVAPPLRAGHHRLRIEVTNPSGPALLSLRSTGLEKSLGSDASWSVTDADGATRAAIPIDVSRRNPSAFAMPTVAEGLRASGVLLAAAFAFGTVASLALQGRGLGPRLAAAIPVLLAALWLGPLARTSLAIPLEVGFDARHHLAYVDFLREHRSLPQASDGWSMFHPPLYYAATALAVEASERVGAHPRLGWKLVGLLAGLTSALAVGLLARRVFGRDSSEAAFATLLAGTLPMNVILSSYVTNESLHAAFATCLVASTAALLLTPTTKRTALAAWTLWVALAALTKYTAWIVAGVGAFFLWAKWLRIEAAGARAITGRVACAAGGVALLAGWFSVRAYANTGQWFPLNVDLPGETHVWWSQPGYTTAAFFTHFGEVFGHPFLAGTHSAWDAFYSTFWGDGQLAGEMIAARRHPRWDWQLMAAGYALAAPATFLMGVGALRALRLSLLARDPGQRAVHAYLLTFAWLLGLSVLYMTLRQPDYGLAKAFYGLAGLAPLACWFGLGAAACERRLGDWAPRWGRALFHGWLASFGVATLLPYL
ncbi:MAG: hypothetical protein JRG84_19385 [Deltaproteobacteria bacterium]|nr:hypothetical protein [Deltaproteobacteria bacterium]